MQKRSDEKMFTYKINHKSVRWVNDNTFELQHNRCVVISNIKVLLDGVVTKCSYKELNPNTLLISLNKNDKQFNDVSVTIFSEMYVTMYKIHSNPFPNYDYLTFVDIHDCIDESTEIVIKSGDGWAYTDTQFKFKNDTLNIQLPIGIIYPIQINVINNNLNIYPQLY